MADAPGTFVAYAPRDFTPERLALVGRIAAILDRAERAGEVYSVRQIFYQMVKANVLPNSEGSYDRVQSAINDGRLAGLISWTAIEDRGRDLRGLRTWPSPAHAIREAAAGYRSDLWADQDWRPEVWIEKAALEGVIANICNQLRVDFYACRGYNSQSEQWRAGRRHARYISKGQRPIVFHLGDHDPSGVDMTRDNQERLSMFAGVPVTVVRIALNMDQVEELSLLPNPTKLTDARAPDYVARYGHESWELDALENDHIRRLISDAVLRLRDPARWEAALSAEVADRQAIEEMTEDLG